MTVIVSVTSDYLHIAQEMHSQVVTRLESRGPGPRQAGHPDREPVRVRRRERGEARGGRREKKNKKHPTTIWIFGLRVRTGKEHQFLLNKK